MVLATFPPSKSHEHRSFSASLVFVAFCSVVPFQLLFDSLFQPLLLPKWSQNPSKIDACLPSHRGSRFTSFLHHFFPLLSCKSDRCDVKNIDLLLGFIGYSGKCHFPLPVVFVLPLCPFPGSISAPNMAEIGPGMPSEWHSNTSCLLVFFFYNFWPLLGPTFGSFFFQKICWTHFVGPKTAPIFLEMSWNVVKTNGFSYICHLPKTKQKIKQSVVDFVFSWNVAKTNGFGHFIAFKPTTLPATAALLFF